MYVVALVVALLLGTAAFLSWWFFFAAHDPPPRVESVFNLADDRGTPPCVVSVINVADDRGMKRRNALRKALADVPYRLVRAHLKEDVSDVLLQEVHARQRHWLASPRNHLKKVHHPLTKGEISLAMSHCSLYELLLSSDAPYTIVAEDDIRVCGGFGACFTDLLHRLPLDFDWIKIEYNDGIAPSRTRRYHPRECRIEPYDAYNKPIDCAAFYIISRTGASIILCANGKGHSWLPADGAMDQYWLQVCSGQQRRGRAFRVTPQLAWQDESIGIEGSHRM